MSMPESWRGAAAACQGWAALAARLVVRSMARSVALAEMRSVARSVVPCAAVALAALSSSAAAGEPPQAEAIAPRLGRPLSETAAARFDLDVFPDGQGLPAGRGTAAEGRALYAARCAACHGPQGRGGTAEELAGAEEPLTARTPDKTIGSYWPYASTVFDFVRRAKPMDAPGSFTADEVYALTAFLLFANGLVGETDPIDATTLPRVRMPNRDGFFGVDAGRER